MMPFRLPWFRRRISNIGDLSPTVGDQHLAHVINEFRLRLSSSISILHRLCSIPWEFHIPFKAKLRSLSLLTDFENWIFTKKISSFNYWNSKSLLRLVCEPTQINSNKIIFCILTTRALFHNLNAYLTRYMQNKWNIVFEILYLTYVTYDMSWIHKVSI